MSDDVNEKNYDNYIVNNKKTTASKSFEYKTKIIGSTQINNNILDTQVVILLKNLTNFLRYLDLSLINSEIGLLELCII